MKKRIVTLLLLALVLAFGMLTACNRNGDPDPVDENGYEETTPDPDPDPVVENGGDDEEVVDPPVANQFEEHVTIRMTSMSAHNAFRDAETGTNWAPNVQYLMDRFNVSFDFYAITWADFIDVTQNWFAVGIAPDVVMLDVHYSRFGAFYVNATLDRFFRPYNLDNNPNLRAAFENGPTAMQAFQINGNLYAWPNASDMNLFVNPYHIDGIMYRRDWANAVGHAQPDGLYTFDQWVEMTKAVQEANPGEVPGGTLGFGGVNWTFPRDMPQGQILKPYNGFVRLPDGSHTWGPFTPEAREIVQITNQLFHDGVIWDDQILDGDYWAAFVGNRLFARVLHGMSFGSMRDHIMWYTWDQGEDALDLETFNHFAENVIGYGLVESPTGGFVVNEAFGIWSQSVMNANIPDNVAERWEAILDFMVTEEGYHLRAWGVQGEHWDFDAAGNFVLMWDRNADGTLVNPLEEYELWDFRRLGNNMDARYEIWIPEDLNPIVHDQWTTLVEAVRGPRTTRNPLNVDLAYFTGPQFLEVGARGASTNDQVVALMMAHPDDVADLWDAWVDAQRPMMQPIVDEINEAFR